MPQDIRRVFGGTLVAIALGTLMLAGCTAASSPPTPTQTPGRPGGGTPIAPGYTPGANGTATVVGFVGRSTLEGGFWAAYGSYGGTSDTVSPNALAVLLPGKVDEAAIAALEGSYVRVTGRVSTGVSTRNAGPEVLVDSIEKLSTQ